MTLTIYLNDKIPPSKDCSSFAVLICITVLLVWHHALQIHFKKDYVYIYIYLLFAQTDLQIQVVNQLTI